MVQMRFSLNHVSVEFEIPDEWWVEAGMTGFRAASKSYTATASDQWPLRIVSLTEVKPPIRSPGVRWFCRKRLVDILAGFVSGAAIPPIPVHEPPGAALKYELRDGFHRFYASAAAGYSHVPISVLPFFDINA